MISKGRESCKMEEAAKAVKRTPILPKREERKPLMRDINHFLLCRLCSGYLVEATSLIECLHTYCRSCIIQFLHTRKCCPVCEIPITNPLRPHLSLQRDSIIQRLVYKMVPGLYENELERRKKFFSTLENNEKMEIGEDLLNDGQHYFTPEELISLSLEYIDENKNSISENPSAGASMNDAEIKSDNVDQGTEPIPHRRYLQCPAAVKIGHIRRLIIQKYNLKNNHEVKILYENKRLPDYFSLMDTAYMFSWTRDGPMQLHYQILEHSFIQVPIVVPNKILDNLSPSVKNPTCTKHPLSSNVNSIHDLGVQNNIEHSGSVSNLKRACEKSDEFREPAVKIPRMGNNTAPVEQKNEKDEVAVDKISKLSVPRMEKGCSFDDVADYEEYIEEVDEDDDDEGRLHISQLSDEETEDNKPDNSRLLIIDTSDTEKVQEDRYEDKKVKSRRKNKKSKHHHHRKHRHHERKKNATQATILHSPDADSGIRLTLKLSNPSSMDPKNHRPSKRKHKKNSDAYSSSFSSSSSVSSLIISSPEPLSSSRADEDSSHSKLSEGLVDTLPEAPSMKKEASNSKVSSTLPSPVTKMASVPIVEKEADVLKLSVTNADKLSNVRKLQNRNEIAHSSPSSKVTNDVKSSNSKEKLLQVCIPRPRSIAVVRPEEHVDENAAKNDNNNNDQSAKVIATIEEKKHDLSVPEIHRSASSSALTVSKITAAEAEKKLFNGNREEPPALEITVVPSNKATAPSPKLGDNAGVTVKPNVQKPIKRVPDAIPLSQYQRMKSNEQYLGNSSLSKLAEHNLPKSLTITPHMVPSTGTVKMNGNMSNKKIKSTPDLKTDGLKQSVTISLSEGDSALDLSGVPKPQIFHSQNKKLLPTSAPGVRPNGMTGINPSKKFPGLLPPGYPMTYQYPTAGLPKVTSTTSTTSNTSFVTTILKSQQVPIRSPPIKMNKLEEERRRKVNSLPPLNEIKKGPPSKPGPNQNVRFIPDVRRLLQRQQQHVPNFGMPSLNVAMMQAMSSPSVKKTLEKCPPAVPIARSYFDHSSLMTSE